MLSLSRYLWAPFRVVNSLLSSQLPVRFFYDSWACVPVMKVERAHSTTNQSSALCALADESFPESPPQGHSSWANISTAYRSCLTSLTKDKLIRPLQICLTLKDNPYANKYVCWIIIWIKRYILYRELHAYPCLSITWEAGFPVVNFETETHVSLYVHSVLLLSFPAKL